MHSPPPRRRSRDCGALIWLVVGMLATVRAETWVLTTYNVENYTLADRMVGGIYQPDYPKPEESKHALRRTIRELSPDVLLLQEVGGRSFLNELQRDLLSEGCPYPQADVLEAADPDRRIAWLARVPPMEVRRHTDLTLPYFGKREAVKRGMIELTFATASGPFTLFVVHLKSRFTDRPDDLNSDVRRGAEATALRNRILERFPDPSIARFLVLGDFNDSRNSRGVRAFLSRGQTQITHLLPAADSRGEVWTHRYAKEDSYSRVDHILVSPGLHPWILEGRARIGDGAHVHEASDHRPVTVTLRMP